MATVALNVETGSCSEKRFVMINKLYFSLILPFTKQSCKSKAFVATFVATERMLLDTTDVYH